MTPASGPALVASPGRQALRECRVASRGGMVAQASRFWAAASDSEEEEEVTEEEEEEEETSSSDSEDGGKTKAKKGTG